MQSDFKKLKFENLKHAIAHFFLNERRQRGFTLEEFADKAGISLTEYKNIEAQAANIRLETIVRMLDSLGIPMNCFMDSLKIKTQVNKIPIISDYGKYCLVYRDDELGIEIKLPLEKIRNLLHKGGMRYGI